MSDELKQAVERVRTNWSNDYIKSSPILHLADCETLARAYLAELDADCTDVARPSWWRGNDHGIRMICDLVNAILDGKDDAVDDGIGIAGEPWESTRRRLLAMVSAIKNPAAASPR